MALATHFAPLEWGNSGVTIDYGMYFQLLRQSLPPGRSRDRCLPHLLQIPHHLMSLGAESNLYHECHRCHQTLSGNTFHVNKNEYYALSQAGGATEVRVLVVVGSVQDLIATPRAADSRNRITRVNEVRVLFETCYYPECLPLSRIFTFLQVDRVRRSHYEFLLRCKMSECPGLSLAECVMLLNPLVDLSMIESLQSEHQMVQYGLSWGVQSLEQVDVLANPLSTWAGSEISHEARDHCAIDPPEYTR